MGAAGDTECLTAAGVSPQTRQTHRGQGSNMDDARRGMGRGFIAVVINIVVVIAVLIVLGLIFGKAHSGHHSASVSLTGVSALIWFVLALAYLIIPKVRTGQTIGWRLVGGRPNR